MSSVRPLHPYLLGLFPVLYLFVHNANEMSARQVVLPALAILGAILLLVGLLNLFIRNPGKSSLVASVLVLYFFSWGYLPIGFRHHKNVLSYGLGLLLIAVVIAILRTRRSTAPATRLLNVVSLGLVALQVGMGAWAVWHRPALERINLAPVPTPTVESRLPDIYYIVPDGYGRHDVLLTRYDYDNSPLLSHLRRRGFFVADRSTSNYGQTALSLTSSLNMSLLDQLVQLDPDSDDRIGFRRLLADNRLYRFLRRYDYRIVVIQPPYEHLRMDGADKTFEPWFELSEFSAALFQTTPLEVAEARFARYGMARERTLYTLDQVTRLDEVESPYFVLAHVICPHPPFLWDAEGRPYRTERPFYDGDGSKFVLHGGTREEYLAGYRNQVRVLDSLLMHAVDGILAARKNDPPVIIIQGDHGPGADLDWESLERTDVRERFPILNAYYLPGTDSTGLYPSISPVNSFRVVLNKYFGLGLPMEEDRAYYSTWKRPFDLVEVTDRLGSTGAPTPR